MLKVRIEVMERGQKSATITVPLWMIENAPQLNPDGALSNLGERIDLDDIARLARDPEAQGVILEIDDHDSAERVVVSVVEHS